MKVQLCALEEIPEQGTKTIAFFGREVLVFRINGVPKAVFNFCVHLGGPMRRDGERLVCEWHGAEFECGHGTRLKGPAPRDSRLITLPTSAEDGVLHYVYGE